MQEYGLLAGSAGLADLQYLLSLEARAHWAKVEHCLRSHTIPQEVLKLADACFKLNVLERPLPGDALRLLSGDAAADLPPAMVADLQPPLNAADSNKHDLVGPGMTPLPSFAMLWAIRPGPQLSLC